MSSAQSNNPDSAERELESFRRQWQEEVRRGKRNPPHQDYDQQEQREARITDLDLNAQRRNVGLKPPTGGNTGLPPEEDDPNDGAAFHDLPSKDDALRLASDESMRKAATITSEPTNALDHYEKAVERETAGSLGDSVTLYRKAFRLDANVHETYKKKHFPAPPKTASHPTAKPNPSNASVTVPNTAHHSLSDQTGQAVSSAPASLNELLSAFSSLSIARADPVIERTSEPPCPIADLPSEVLLRVLQASADLDIATLPRLAVVCRKLAYLITTEDSLWKTIALDPHVGIMAMRYRYTMQIPEPWHSLRSVDPFNLTPTTDLTPKTYPTYRAQFRHRARVRFGGCYISVNNYTRPGLPAQDRRTSSTPVHIVTYYRYMRFYGDGSCISLQTSAEPRDVVHYMTKETLQEERRREHERRGAATANFASVVMRDGLCGRWRLSGSSSGPAPRLEDEDEPLGKRPGEYAKEPISVFDGGLMDDQEAIEDEGTVHVETEGVNSKYLWKMEYALGSSGRKDATRNNRLTWKGFWSYNRLADDWAPFSLKHDKSLYWSRVKSWGEGE